LSWKRAPVAAATASVTAAAVAVVETVDTRQLLTNNDRVTCWAIANKFFCGYLHDGYAYSAAVGLSPET